MANFNIVLNGPIQVFDLNNNLITTKSITGVTVPVSDYASGTLAVSAAAAAITLPVSPTNFMYLRNDGTAVAVVSWIPQGGSGVIVQNLGVSSTMSVAQVGQGGSTGITALTVSCAAATTVEYFLAG
jgi:hypothetical protein